MAKIIKAEVVGKYLLLIEFDDGLKGVIDLGARLFGPMFAPLQDEAFFAQVRVDEYGAVCWPNGADLAPDAIYRNLSRAPQAIHN
ncbi:MAG TPA: DUF2442 domain-containing protein [Desulfobacterales bacterium]|nr:DUF2442 domain-containing protein [Desulfobacterales bacterium]